MSWQGGGKVASGMVAAARLGLCCGIMGNVGDDKYGTFCLRDFQDHVPKGTFVKLNPLIVHGTQYPVDKEDVHIVCMLPGRTFKNDMLSRRLETGEQIRITRGCKK